MVDLMVVMIGVTFWVIVFLLFMAVKSAGKAAGSAAKTAMTERPVETMKWIKFFVDVARK